jgi:hypothetical protein
MCDEYVVWGRKEFQNKPVLEIAGSEERSPSRKPEQIVACQRDRLLESKYQQTMSDAPVALSYAGYRLGGCRGTREAGGLWLVDPHDRVRRRLIDQSHYGGQSAHLRGIPRLTI